MPDIKHTNREVSEKNLFRFKQFSVFHHNCNLKITTDSILLGAWVDINHCHHILDVGTGNGVIALMLAQRCEAQIDAIDISEDNYYQALENFKNSPWYSRLNAYHISLQNFAPTSNYDHIVCNPPFFQNSLPSKNKSTSIAKHNICLSIEDFFRFTTELLNEIGRISIIMPFDEKERAIQSALKWGLSLTRMLKIKTTAHKPVKRVLLEFSNHYIPLTIEEISIYCKRNEYSNEYIKLTKDYYLHF